MNTAQIALFLFSSIGILNSLFFSAWLFVTKRGQQWPNRLLALLLLALAVRVSKSLFYFLLDGIHIGFINAGLVGKVAIGPFLLLYVYAVIQKSFTWKRAYWWHFVPSIVLALTTPFLSWEFVIISYRLAMAQMLVYLIWSFVVVYRYKQGETEAPKGRWLANLCLAVGLVWLAYLSQMLMGGLTVYAIGAAWFSLVVYAVLFLALKQQKLVKARQTEAKYQTSNVSHSELDKYQSPLLKLMDKEKVYLDRNLSLRGLAEQLEIRPDVLSRLVNEKFEKNFNDFINGYRIQEACELLAKPDWANMKIAAVAIDSGFKSISAFNTAFKKSSGMTPSQYRERFNESFKLI